jgi:hypothetical protein
MNMAELNYSCDVSQAYNFSNDVQIKVGHIVSCTIGDEELESDMKVQDPEDTGGEKISVFGVVSAMYWGGGYADPIQFSCQVSNPNKVKLAQLLQGATLSNTGVKFKFNIYDYDFDAKVYYKCFHTDDNELEGLIQKSGGQLSIAIDMDQNMQVVSPKNFSFSLGVMPEDKEQELTLAFSSDSPVALQWGVEVGG